LEVKSVAVCELLPAPSYRKELPADRVKKLVGVVWIKIGSEDEVRA